MAAGGPPRRSLNILDRPLPKTRQEVKREGVRHHAHARSCVAMHPCMAHTHPMRASRTSQVPTVSLSAFAFLTSEILQYTMDNASSTSDLDER
jgi:hypothetical protein